MPILHFVLTVIIFQDLKCSDMQIKEKTKMDQILNPKSFTITQTQK